MSAALVATIHRGSREVGGSCVELISGGKRLLLDIGRPLDAEDVVLPAGLGVGGPSDPDLLGAVITHGHADHYGLAPALSPDLPLFMGEATERILAEAAFFSRDRIAPRAAAHLRDRIPVSIGPFTVTPYLVDHSAFDAYALLVEAGGRRLFYTGDLRAHGRKSGTFERLVSEPPPRVDALLMEGTRIGRAGAHGDRLSETDVERAAARVFGRTKGMALVFYSVQNVDRLVTLFRAARRSGRLFVLDLYGAAVVAATGNPRIPQPDWPEVRVFAPASQRVRVKEEQAFERVRAVRAARIYPEDLPRLADRLVVTFRHSMRREFERAGCLGGAGALWSLWPGYLDGTTGLETRRWLDARDIPLTIAHASGHATPEDLRRLADAFAPARVVPIHTGAPDTYERLLPRVERHEDGEAWAV